MKYHIWTIIRKWKGCRTMETATHYWKHLFFQAWLQIMSRKIYAREAHDFIIWLDSIYLDIISNNYSHYLSDMLPLFCSEQCSESPCCPHLSAPQMYLRACWTRFICKEEQPTWIHWEAPWHNAQLVCFYTIKFASSSEVEKNGQAWVTAILCFSSWHLQLETKEANGSIDWLMVGVWLSRRKTEIQGHTGLGISAWSSHKNTALSPLWMTACLLEAIP